MATNKPLINIDSNEEKSKYIDEICSDNTFLCKNVDICSTSKLYSGKDSIKKICDNISSEKCDTPIKECVVQATDTIGDSNGYVLTSFVNIIIPIANEFDDKGNQKFLRLPPLSASKKPNSQDICDICACVNRFSTGGGDYTAPGLNVCTYQSNFEYFYYPLSIENINSKLINTPPIKLGKYNVINSNIIATNSEENISVENLYDLLIENKILEFNAVTFINYLYKNNEEKRKKLQLYIIDKKQIKKKEINKGKFYENISFFYFLFTIFLVAIFFILIKLF